MLKSLDTKLARISTGAATAHDFIIADAKDADMAFGLASPGPRTDGGGFRTLSEYRDQIRAIIAQGVVDIMLMSASTVEQLAIKETLFADSAVTPAARANDTSDIWVVRGGVYTKRKSRPFRSATLDHIMHGRLDAAPGTPAVGADLGLYSMTFANDLDADHATLEAFAAFRQEAERKGFRYFLEVFNPNVETGIAPEQVPAFVNDHIARALAGVTGRGRPVFLKIPYNGPKALEDLVAYDSSVVVGVLGGGAGTTRDAFQLIHDAQKHGARVALFGRKINHAENPLSFIAFLRRITDGVISPEDAVKAYHSELSRMKITPHRSLEADLRLTDTTLSYS